MIILGVDVDAAVQPVITLFDGSNSMGSGVSVAFYSLFCKYHLNIMHPFSAQQACTIQSASSLSCRVPSLPDGVGVGVQYNFTITFDQYTLYSQLEQALIGTQSYLETTGNPTLEPFDETYTSGSGRTISISVSTV